MKLQKALIFSFIGMLTLFISSCSTTLQVVDANVQPITLNESQQSHFYITDVVTFPAGTYTADFKTKEGIFYRAPAKLIHSVMGGSAKRPRNGGLFIPYQNDKDQRLGVWFDNQGGGDIGLGSPSKVWRLRDTIKYAVAPNR